MSENTSADTVTEMAAAPSTFSYAQAAKRESMLPNNAVNGTNLPAGSKIGSDDMKSSHVPSPQTSEENIREKHEIAGSMENPEKASSVPRKESPRTEQAEETNSADSTPHGQEKAVSSAQDTSPIPSQQPTPGTTVEPAKGDDVFTTSNEADSAWEQVSQESQTEASSGKVEGDGDDSKLSTWEHVQKPQLKEAPIPTVNFWQKRAMDAKASKAKDALDSSPNPQQNHGSSSPPENITERARRKETGAATSRETVKARSPEGQATHKGNRTPETAKVAGTVAPPPPPGDTTSWPTPGLAQEEEKRKVSDRGDRTDKEKTPSRHHGKEKWEKVDYVPSAVFSTPLPISRRGGRGGGRGGRDGATRGGHAANGGGAGNDRAVGGPNSTEPSSNVSPPNERSRPEAGQSKPGLGGSKPRRAASAGPPSSREQSRAIDGPQDKREDGAVRQFSGKPFRENRRISTSIQAESGQKYGVLSGGYHKRQSVGPEQLPDSTNPGDHAATRPGQGDNSFRSQEWSRDGNGYGPSRERGRSERGRGGYRSKGPQNYGNYNSNGSQQPNGQGFGPNKFSHYSEQRHNSQPHAQPYSSSREPRHGRGPSRSMSVTQPPAHNKYPNGPPHGGPHQLPPLQVGTANAYGDAPEHQAPMSAVNFHPMMESMQLQGIVQMQIEYYFSVDNLCKDMFLRRNMDSQGFVFLHVLQNFNRIRRLTVDFGFLRWVCVRSAVLELRMGLDGIDRVRKADDWQQWILAVEERDPSAQNDGPAQVFSPYYAPQYGYSTFGPYDYPQGSVSSTPLSPRDPISGNGTVIQAPPLDGNAAPGQISEAQPTLTPLSAAVPDFQPSSQAFTNSSSYESVEDSMAHEGTFSDDKIDQLTIIVRRPKAQTKLNRSPPTSPPVVGTHSNGHESLPTKDEVKRNGDPERADATKNGNGEIDGSRSAQDTSSEQFLKSLRILYQYPNNYTTDAWSSKPTYWLPGKMPWLPNEQDESEDLVSESYVTFRSKALQMRERVPDNECHPDMAILYKFWTHFLNSNLNLTMYEEFRTLALTDVTERDSQTGLELLSNFYYECLLGPNIIPDRLAKDFVDIVHTDVGKKTDRPAFNALRAAWRNGALNFKSRMKINGLVNNELKTELEQY